MSPCGRWTNKVFPILSLLLTVTAGSVDKKYSVQQSSIHPRRRSLLARQESTPKFMLIESYEGDSFFDGWDFWSYPDPTHGLVNYVDSHTAFSERLAYVDSTGTIVLTLDTVTTIQPGENRKSIHSKKSYYSGLFVLDVEAMPHGPAVWPAFWMCGPDWPAGGEIDILEGVHDQRTNHYTLHTAPGCMLDVSRSLKNVLPVVSSVEPQKVFSGRPLAIDCDASLNFNAGCSIADEDETSYGHSLNEQGGGVFATLWDDEGIRIWYFPRSSVPVDLEMLIPDPSTWPSPKAFWSSDSCPTKAYFSAHKLIINISLCGDWAGATYESLGLSGTCAERVSDPSNFEAGEWRINSIRVYQ